MPSQVTKGRQLATCWNPPSGSLRCVFCTEQADSLYTSAITSDYSEPSVAITGESACPCRRLGMQITPLITRATKQVGKIRYWQGVTVSDTSGSGAPLITGRPIRRRLFSSGRYAWNPVAIRPYIFRPARQGPARHPFASRPKCGFTNSSPGNCQ